LGYDVVTRYVAPDALKNYRASSSGSCNPTNIFLRLCDLALQGRTVLWNIWN